MGFPEFLNFTQFLGYYPCFYFTLYVYIMVYKKQSTFSFDLRNKIFTKLNQFFEIMFEKQSRK
jgi:hypothetical protein